jgi:hypothetical protein
VRRRGRALDLLARRVRHRAVGDVRRDGVVEEQHVLRHHRDLARRLASVSVVTSWPSMNMRPAVGS